MDPLPSQGTIHDILVSEFPTSFLSSFFVVRAPRFYNASCDFLSESGSLMSCNRGVAQVCMFTGGRGNTYNIYREAFDILASRQGQNVTSLKTLTPLPFSHCRGLISSPSVIGWSAMHLSLLHTLGRPWSSWRSTYLSQPHTTLPMTNFACIQDP